MTDFSVFGFVFGLSALVVFGLGVVVGLVIADRS